MTEARAGEGQPLVVDAALFGGVRLIDLTGETYRLKAVPVAGISLFPRLELSKPLHLSIDVSFSYTFRSDYRGFYYYDSFGSIGIVPELGLLFPGKDLNWAVFMGGGFFASFSDYESVIHPAVAARIGLEFRRGFIRGVFLSYNHRFAEGYQTHESFKLFASTRIVHPSYGRRE